jgi:hypothetical protein
VRFAILIDQGKEARTRVSHRKRRLLSVSSGHQKRDGEEVDEDEAEEEAEDDEEDVKGDLQLVSRSRASSDCEGGMNEGKKGVLGFDS